MTQEHRTQETPTSAHDSDELPAAALALVVGGGDTGPGGPGDNNGVVESGKATPVLF